MVKKNIPVSPKTSSGIMYSEEEWARVWKKRPVKYIEDIIHGDVNGMCIYIYSYLFTYIYIYIYIHLYVFICTYLFLFIYLYIYNFIDIIIYISMHI